MNSGGSSRLGRTARTLGLAAGLSVALVSGWLGMAGSAAAATPAEASPVPAPRELAVCADPANLPFSNEQGEGFENRIARLVADELHANLRYAWNMQRRGFLRRTLHAGACDLVLGSPVGLQGVLTTRPYYRSGYVFVSRAGTWPGLGSLDDPRLRTATIGLHALGAEGANTPPAMALARRGVVGGVRGYPMWGEEGDPSPPAHLIEAVARGEVDMAIVWGPIAGYFSQRFPGQLVLSPVVPDAGQPELAFDYDIAMSVRRGDEALRAEVQAALDRRRTDVQAILKEFGVPLNAVSR